MDKYLVKTFLSIPLEDSECSLGYRTLLRGTLQRVDLRPSPFYPNSNNYNCTLRTPPGIGVVEGVAD